uniref:Uncharacterized protein n=1 Tax=Salix viminalis TaxID=40686 RepID=A0A6N2MTG1_SALVM
MMEWWYQSAEERVSAPTVYPPPPPPPAPKSHLVRHDMDLNYVSKRRVPNGPDPIHNRYTLLSTEITSACTLDFQKSVQSSQ